MAQTEKFFVYPHMTGRMVKIFISDQLLKKGQKVAPMSLEGGDRFHTWESVKAAFRATNDRLEAEGKLKTHPSLSVYAVPIEAELNRFGQRYKVIFLAGDATYTDRIMLMPIAS